MCLCSRGTSTRVCGHIYRLYCCCHPRKINIPITNLFSKQLIINWNSLLNYYRENGMQIHLTQCFLFDQYPHGAFMTIPIKLRYRRCKWSQSLKILTSRRNTSWLYTKRVKESALGKNKQCQYVSSYISLCDGSPFLFLLVDRTVLVEISCHYQFLMKLLELLQ